MTTKFQAHELDLEDINKQLPGCYFYLETTISFTIYEVTYHAQLKRGKCVRFWIGEQKSFTQFKRIKIRSYIPYLEAQLVDQSHVQINTWRVAKRLFVDPHSYLSLIPHDLAIKILELTQCRELIDCNKLLTHAQSNACYTIQSKLSDWDRFQKVSPIWDIVSPDGGSLNLGRKQGHGFVLAIRMFNNYLRQSEWKLIEWLALTGLWHRLCELNGQPRSNIPARLTLKGLLKQIDQLGVVEEDLLN